MYYVLVTDDNWQACGFGVDGTFHDAQGNPIINIIRFPDMQVSLWNCNLSLSRFMCNRCFFSFVTLSPGHDGVWRLQGAQRGVVHEQLHLLRGAQCALPCLLA